MLILTGQENWNGILTKYVFFVAAVPPTEVLLITGITARPYVHEGNSGILTV